MLRERTKHMLHVRIGIACLVAALLGQNGFGADVADDKTFTDQVRPFLVKHCQECHNEKKPKGDFRVDTLTADFDKLVSRDHWQTVLKKVKAGEMPPEGKPRPSADERRLLILWVDGESQRAELARRAREGRVVLRRLNRIEYQNTIRDLLGIQVNLIDQLPEDGSANGFDNAAAALH